MNVQARNLILVLSYRKLPNLATILCMSSCAKGYPTDVHTPGLIVVEQLLDAASPPSFAFAHHHYGHLRAYRSTLTDSSPFYLFFLAACLLHHFSILARLIRQIRCIYIQPQRYPQLNGG